MKNSTDSSSTFSNTKQNLADRLREVRVALYGKEGGPELAHLLGIPARSWTNYENGVTIPGEVLLVLLVLTSTEPLWLFCGDGMQFRPTGEKQNAHPFNELKKPQAQISSFKV